jgi:hypothetical protein
MPEPGGSNFPRDIAMNQPAISHLITVYNVAERISEIPMETLGDLSSAGFDGVANQIQELKTSIDWSKAESRPPEDALLTTLPRARRTDPETSHKAARSVTKTGVVHLAILRLLRGGSMTDEQLWHEYERGAVNWPVVSPSGLRTRRSELCRLGKVRDSGKRRTLTSGRQGIVWEAVWKVV